MQTFCVLKHIFGCYACRDCLNLISVVLLAFSDWFLIRLSVGYQGLPARGRSWYCTLNNSTAASHISTAAGSSKARDTGSPGKDKAFDTTSWWWGSCKTGSSGTVHIYLIYHFQVFFFITISCLCYCLFLIFVNWNFTLYIAALNIIIHNLCLYVELSENK